MYVQVKKDPNQEWFPTWYMLTKEDMGYIMEDWVVYWKIPPIETESEKPKMQPPDTEELSSIKEE
jgi:hypothetical protein